MADRCRHVEPRMGRCWDDSGQPHGHHFRPYTPEPSLMPSADEARELVAYMRPQYLNRNAWPRLASWLDRLEVGA
jgi:hypothetical protein